MVPTWATCERHRGEICPAQARRRLPVARAPRRLAERLGAPGTAWLPARDSPSPARSRRSRGSAAGGAGGGVYLAVGCHEAQLNHAVRRTSPSGCLGALGGPGGHFAGSGHLNLAGGTHWLGCCSGGPGRSLQPAHVHDPEPAPGGAAGDRTRAVCGFWAAVGTCRRGAGTLDITHTPRGRGTAGVRRWRPGRTFPSCAFSLSQDCALKLTVLAERKTRSNFGISPIRSEGPFMTN